MKRIRAGSGLGDSLYLQSVVRHLLARGEKLQVCSAYPEVFRPLPVGVVPFTRLGVEIVAHYVTRKGIAGTDQFEDMCRAAGITEPAELRLDWTPVNVSLVRRIRRAAGERPVVVVQLPRAPMGRTDGFGKELLPDCRVIQRCIDRLGGAAFIVQIGAGEALHKFHGIDLDLTNQTSVSELIDVAWEADGFLGYCSFVVPLAESLAKPALLVWSRRGQRAPQAYIRQVTPEKVLHGDGSVFVWDDWTEARIGEVVDAFRRKVGSRGALRGADGGDRRERAGIAA